MWDAKRMAPPDVDRTDITVIAVLMGIGINPMLAELDALRELKARRDAGEDVSWDDL